MAEPRQEGPVRLEYVEARPVEGLAEFGLAHVARLAVAEPLEGRRRHEPAEGADGGAEPFRSTHLPKRLDHPRRAVVREKDRVPARLERPAARRQERPRVRSEERRVGKECRSRWSPY